MTTKILSRTYLKDLPEQRKRDRINDEIDKTIYQIEQIAASGGTSYMYVKSRDFNGRRIMFGAMSHGLQQLQQSQQSQQPQLPL